MRTPIALLASTALLMPAAVLASPAKAAPSAASATITNCSKTKHGVTVRIKMRNEGPSRFTRVRVSHPDGKGNFREPRVRSTSATWGQIGSGVTLDPPPGSVTAREVTTASSPYTTPTFRVGGGTNLSVHVTFRLTSGKRIFLTCRQ